MHAYIRGQQTKVDWAFLIPPCGRCFKIATLLLSFTGFYIGPIILGNVYQKYRNAQYIIEWVNLQAFWDLKKKMKKREKH